MRTAIFLFAIGLLVVESPATASPSERRGGVADPEARRSRACAVEPYRSQGTAVGCLDLGFIAVLPGRGWTLDAAVPSAPRVLLSARFSPHFHVSVLRAGRLPEPREFDAETVLRGLYARVATSNRSRGISLRPAEIGRSRPNRPTLEYEAEGLSIDERPYRSIHIWTFARRPNGERLDYHASWTGPAESFDPGLPPTLRAMTAGFVLVDRQGEALPH